MLADLVGRVGEVPGVEPLELDRLLEGLGQSRTATIRGVRCAGGREWRFEPAPARNK